MADLEIREIAERLKEGVKHFEQGDLERGRAVFEGYLEKHPDNPVAMSYVGMILAVKNGQTHEGLNMCQQAAKNDPQEMLCFLNLARVYLYMGDRYLCVRALNKGLKLKSTYKGYLNSFHQTIGRRRPPLLRSLGRNHVINTLIGRLTWRLKSRD